MIERQADGWWTWGDSNPPWVLTLRNLLILGTATYAKNAQTAERRYAAGTRLNAILLESDSEVPCDGGARSRFASVRTPASRMKPEEESASTFLKGRFGREPHYEPLGKSTPPDFSIEGTAFEVRRLNQRYLHEDGTNEGLEQVDIPLNLALHRELSKIPFSEQGGTMFWGSKFKRPLADEVRNIVNQLAAAAREHYSEGSRRPKQIAVASVTLDLFAASTPTGKALRMGYAEDDDSGGMLGEIYPTSIRLALEDKIAKTKDIADKFNRWVLILIDDVLPGIMEPNDIGPLHLNLGHFSSVLVINPDGTLVLEWPDGSLERLKI
jgi:hypothetical protein